jgi:hypothetical protein
MPNSNYTVLGKGSEFDGMSIEQWTESWWQWAMQLPSGEDNNPFQEDHFSFNADAGDVGDVFFLAGIAGTDEDNTPDIADAERTILVSSKDTILLPVLNWAESLPNLLDDASTDPSANIDAVSNWVNGIKNAVTDAFVEIDGEKIFDYDPMTPSNAKDYYVQTDPLDPFSLGTVEPGDLGYDVFGQGPANVAQEPALAGGWWVAIQDLSLGKHEVTFGGTIDFDPNTEGVDFSLNITDTIYVLPPGIYKVAEDALDYFFG